MSAEKIVLNNLFTENIGPELVLVDTNEPIPCGLNEFKSVNAGVTHMNQVGGCYTVTTNLNNSEFYHEKLRNIIATTDTRDVVFKKFDYLTGFEIDSPLNVKSDLFHHRITGYSESGTFEFFLIKEGSDFDRDSLESELKKVRLILDSRR